jgi:WD40 repeat protein/energy-coupling factor transporter ATP-binding protein EcfA2
MASIFISHSSKDVEAAAAVRKKLEAAGYSSVFLDFDPEDGIPAGRNWEEELYAQLRMCDAVLLLISAASAASRWCFAEIALARSVRKPVLPLAIEEGATHPLVEDKQIIALWKEPAEGYKRLWRGLKLAGLDPSQAFAWDPQRSPYPGLEAFDLEDAAVFFGRQGEIEQVLSLLQPALSRETGRLVGVVGASGSGKSSLVRAGVAPLLQRRKERWIVLRPMVPGARPVATLARTIAAALGNAKNIEWKEVEKRLRGNGRALSDFGHDLCLRSRTGAREILLVIDQLEELVTRSTGDERDVFLGLLRAALEDDDSPWSFLVTLRAEYLTASAGGHSLANLLRHSMVLGPLDPGRLHEVIARPARKAGMTFEDGLAGRMVQETVEGDLLPLLAFTLRRLYERALDRHHLEITHADYDEIGGVKGSLELQAQRVLDELAAQHEQKTILRTLTRLATVDRDYRVVRRRLGRGQFDAREQEVLQAFTTARLVRADVENDEPVFEVAHEALLKHWRPLRDAIEEVREKLRLGHMLTVAAEDWKSSGREASYLVHRSVRLEEAESAAGAGLTLRPLEREYLEACLAQREREQSEQERQQRDLSRAVAMRTWESARTVRPEQPLLSLQLTAQAAQIVPNPQVRENIVLDSNQLRLGPHLLAFLESEAGGALFAPNGQYLVTFGGREVRFWSAEDGSPIDRKIPHLTRVASVEFNGDGSRLLVRGQGPDTVARLWDPQGGQPVGDELAYGNQLDQAIFGPEGKRALTLHFDTACLWNAQTGERLPQTLKTLGRCLGAQFSQDGRFVLMTGLGSVRLYDVETGEAAGPDLKAGGYFEGARLSADGKIILTWSHDNPFSDGVPTGTVRLWDAATGENLATIDNGIVRSQGATFCSEDDKCIVTWGSGKARVFDVPSGQSKGVEVDHHVPQWGGVFEVLAAQGEPQVLSVGAGVARLWYPWVGPSPGEDVHHARCTAAAFDPTRRRFATWGQDLTLTVRLWDMDLHEALGPEMMHETTVTEVRFGPRGDRMVTRTKKGTVRLWKAITRASFVHAYPIEGAGGSYDATFNPDGSRVLVSSGRTARQWDADQGEPIGAALTYDGIAGSGIRGGCYGPGGERIATWGDVVHIWKAATGERLAQIDHPGWITGVGWQPDGNRLVTWGGKTVRIWEARNGAPAGKPLDCGGDVGGGILLPDGNRLLIWIENSLRLWDVEKGEMVWQSGAHDQRVFGVAVNRDFTRILSWPKFLVARLWDSETGNQIGPDLDHGRFRLGPVFSPDGLSFLTWSEKSAHLHDSGNAGEMGEPFASEEEISGACFSEVGTRILTWGGTRVRLWDVASRDQIGASIKLDLDVDGALFGRGDNVVLIWGKDQCARLFDVTTGTPVGRVMKHEHFLDAACFSPDGRFVLLREMAGRPRLWRIAGDKHPQAKPLAALVSALTGSRLEPSDGTVVALEREDWEKTRETAPRTEFRSRHGCSGRDLHL